MSPERADSSAPVRQHRTDCDLLAALDDLLSEVGLSAADPGGAVSFTGHDPILPAAHRLGVSPALAGRDDEHRLAEPDAYDAPTLLGDVRMLAPTVRFSSTRPAWPAPLLVPRGSCPASWQS